MNVAGGEHALVGLEGEAAGHQRAMLVEQEIVGLGPVAAADDVDVAGAARHDQAGRGALALDQRVDGDGRAVDELVDGGGLEPALVQAIDDALHQVGRRGQALGLHEGAGRLIEADEIRERSADIDCNDEHADSPRRPVILRAVVKPSRPGNGVSDFLDAAFWLQVDRSVKALDMPGPRRSSQDACLRQPEFAGPRRGDAVMRQNDAYSSRAGDQCIHRHRRSVSPTSPIPPEPRMGRKSAPRAAAARPGVRLAADIGGTFTDIAVFDDRTGKLIFGKALSTPGRLVDGISAGVEKAGSDYGAAGLFLHGSTVAINTVLERTGARTALIITRGLSRHLRDRPHQPAGRLQSVLPEARAAGRAGAALRGRRSGCSPTARSTGRSTRPRSRGWASGCASSGSRPAPSCSSIATPSPSTRRAPRRSWRPTIPACSSRPRTS